MIYIYIIIYISAFRTPMVEQERHHIVHKCSRCVGLAHFVRVIAWCIRAGSIWPEHMVACVCTCVYVCMYVYMYTHQSLACFACVYVCMSNCAMHSCLEHFDQSTWSPACVHVFMYVCIYLRMYECIYRHTPEHMVALRVCMCLCMHVYTYVCMNVSIYTHKSMCLSACVHVCMFVCMYM
jgi:hypothetical protein